MYLEVVIDVANVANGESAIASSAIAAEDKNQSNDEKQLAHNHLILTSSSYNYVNWQFQHQSQPSRD